jgi:hypothetical protein
LRLFNLEADPLNGPKLLFRQVDEESDAEVIQPCRLTPKTVSRMEVNNASKWFSVEAIITVLCDDLARHTIFQCHLGLRHGGLTLWTRTHAQDEGEQKDG